MSSASGCMSAPTMDEPPTSDGSCVSDRPRRPDEESHRLVGVIKDMFQRSLFTAVAEINFGGAHDATGSGSCHYFVTHA
jgi:hypothetical protein